MKIRTVQDIGNIARERRKQQGLTQAEVASWCNVGTRFISEMERGKESLEVGKMLFVLSGLGLDIKIEER